MTKITKFIYALPLSFFFAGRILAFLTQVFLTDFNGITFFALSIIVFILFKTLDMKFSFSNRIFLFLSNKVFSVILIFSLALSPIFTIAERYICGSSTFFQGWGLGVISSIFLVVLYKAFIIFFRQIKLDFKALPALSRHIFPLCAWAVFTVICVGLAFFSNTIYVYDYAIFHTRAAEYAALLTSDPIALCGKIFTSFGTDYSSLPSLIPMLFSLLLGNSRWVYILAVSVNYLPLFYLIYMFCAKLAKRVNLCFCLCVMMFPVLLFLLQKGFPDVGGMVFVLIALYCVFFIQSVNSRLLDFFTGVLLALAFLFRRYELMPVLAIFLLQAVCGIWEFFKNRDKGGLVRFMCTSFGFAAIPFIAFQSMMNEVLFGKSYADIYSYYQLGFAVSISYILKAFGAILLLTVLLSVLIFFKNKIVIYSFCGMIITSVLFLSTQTPDKHHMVIFVPWIMIISIVFIDFMLGRGKLFFASITVFAVMQSSLAFLPVHKDPIFHNILIHTESESQFDTQQILSISEFLSENTDAENPAYVLGISEIFSVEKLRNANFSLNGNLAQPNLLPSAIIDSRDSLPDKFFDCKYIVLADPIQYERGEQFQQIIKIPAQMLIQGQGWGGAFEEIELNFNLENNTKIYIYQRTREVTDSEKQALLDILTQSVSSLG